MGLAFGPRSGSRGLFGSSPYWTLSLLMPDGPGERTGALDYEELVDGGDAGFEFPDVDENAAAAMCYTSGTTGRPKGVVYSHRSTVLHSLCVNQPNAVEYLASFAVLKRRSVKRHTVFSYGLNGAAVNQTVLA